MKKIYSFLLVLLTCSMYAQIWCTPNSIWYFDTSSPAFNTTYTQHTYLYDTLVGSTPFNKIKSQRVGEGVSGYINQSGFFYTSVLGNVVFFNSSNPSIPNAVDTLIYFGPVGSKWRCQPNGNSCQYSYIEITEAGNSIVQGQNLNWRKINYKNYYYFGTINQYSVTGTDTIFERIGYKHLAFQFLGHCGDMTDLSTSSFRCFFDNQLSIHATTVACDYTTGTNEINLESGNVIIYPNPGSDLLHISFSEKFTDNNSSYRETIELKIVNTLGEIVLSDSVLENKKIISINIGDLPPGVYFIRINNKLLRKMIKQ